MMHLLPPSIWILLLIASLTVCTFAYLGKMLIKQDSPHTILPAEAPSSLLWALQLAFGSALVSWFFSLFTASKIPSHSPEMIAAISWILFLLLASGTFLLFREKSLTTHVGSQASSPLERVFLFLCVFAIGIQILSATQIEPHGDGFVAYLRGPRIAFEAGSWKAIRTASVTFLASSWESTWSWINFIFPQRELSALTSIQIFAQLITALVGTTGVALITHAFFGTWTASFAALTVPGLIWLEHLSKNDLGVSFWALCSTWLLIQGVRTENTSRDATKLFFSGGVLAGLAVIGKPTLAVFMVALGLTLLVQLWVSRALRTKIPALVIWGALGSVIGMFPILLRNYLSTGNPIFPWAEGHFHTGFVGPTSLASDSAGTNVRSVDFNLLALHAQEYLHEFPLLTVLPLLLLSKQMGWLTLLRSRPVSTTLFNSLVLSTVLYAILVRPQTEMRYHLPALFLWGAWLTSVLLRVRWKTAWIRLLWMSSFTVILVANSNIPSHRLVKLIQGRLSADLENIEHHPSGPAKKWILQHKALFDEGTLLVLGDNQGYYLSPVRPLLITDQPELEKRLIAIWGTDATPDTVGGMLQSTLDTLTQSKITSLYVDRRARNFMDGHYFEGIRSSAEQTLPPNCLLYSDEIVLVIDLKCWKDSFS